MTSELKNIFYNPLDRLYQIKYAEIQGELEKLHEDYRQAKAEAGNDFPELSAIREQREILQQTLDSMLEQFVSRIKACASLQDTFSEVIKSPNPDHYFLHKIEELKVDAMHIAEERDAQIAPIKHDIEVVQRQIDEIESKIGENIDRIDERYQILLDHYGREEEELEARIKQMPFKVFKDAATGKVTCTVIKLLEHIQVTRLLFDEQIKKKFEALGQDITAKYKELVARNEIEDSMNNRADGKIKYKKYHYKDIFLEAAEKAEPIIKINPKTVSEKEDKENKEKSNEIKALKEIASQVKVGKWDRSILTGCTDNTSATNIYYGLLCGSIGLKMKGKVYCFPEIMNKYGIDVTKQFSEQMQTVLNYNIAIDEKKALEEKKPIEISIKDLQAYIPKALKDSQPTISEEQILEILKKAIININGKEYQFAEEPKSEWFEVVKQPSEQQQITLTYKIVKDEKKANEKEKEKAPEEEKSYEKRNISEMFFHNMFNRESLQGVTPEAEVINGVYVRKSNRQPITPLAVVINDIYETFMIKKVLKTHPKKNCKSEVVDGVVYYLDTSGKYTSIGQKLNELKALGPQKDDDSFIRSIYEIDEKLHTAHQNGMLRPIVDDAEPLYVADGKPEFLSELVFRAYEENTASLILNHLQMHYRAESEAEKEQKKFRPLSETVYAVPAKIRPRQKAKVE